MTVALKMEIEQSYKKRKGWLVCINNGCGHLIAPDGEPKICMCATPNPKRQILEDM